MHGLMSYRLFGRARSLRSDRAGQRDKIGAAPYDGCLRILVEGIKPFVVRRRVKVLMTCFPARPLRSSFYVEVIRRVAADGILYGLCKLAGFLKTLEYWQRDKFWDLVSRFLILCLEMLETSALGLGQDLAWRMAELVACSIQLGAGRVVDPARPSAELDWSSSADGRAGRVFDPARRSAEVDWFNSADGRAGRIQLGGWPSWLRGRSSSAIHRAGLVQIGGWPTWSRDHNLCYRMLIDLRPVAL
ncbi:hypothetical protein F2Q69_00013339 [Brassica cretica]|uniref:Uncharacterized protein n=1 Tax=Brassica cretica TaxID=69181 RepID=A0A8S9QKK5_BRACR|nr:hypothetical protein F2Q69_00013339 [Brassica cretica]